jgi:hypothetical protein
MLRRMSLSLNPWARPRVDSRSAAVTLGAAAGGGRGGGAWCRGGVLSRAALLSLAPGRGVAVRPLHGRGADKDGKSGQGPQVAA